MQVMLLWWEMILRGCLPSFYRCSTEHYMEHNASWMQQHSATAAPRQYVGQSVNAVHVGIWSCVLGVADALSSTLASTSGDSFMFAFGAVVLSSRNKCLRACAVAATLLAVMRDGPPHMWHLSRIACLWVSLLGVNSNMPWKYRVIRLVVFAMVAIASTSELACSSLLRGIPLAMLSTWCLTRGHASPAGTFIIVSLIL